MGEVYAIVSGKGGTGKTSVCAGLACALAEQEKKILCIDCDVGLRNLDISLGMSDVPALSFLDVSEGSYRLEDAARHPKYPTLRFFTAPMNRSPEAIDTRAFGNMLRQARQAFDFVFLDAPAGVDAARVSDLLELSGKKNVRLIVNRVDEEMLSTVRLTIDDVMDTTGTPLAGVVPEDPNITLSAAFGSPVPVYAKRCAAARAFRRIAARLEGIPTKIKL